MDARGLSRFSEVERNLKSTFVNTKWVSDGVFERPVKSGKDLNGCFSKSELTDLNNKGNVLVPVTETSR